jgi:hypothetical protein
MYSLIILEGNNLIDDLLINKDKICYSKYNLKITFNKNNIVLSFDITSDVINKKENELISHYYKTKDLLKKNLDKNIKDINDLKKNIYDDEKYHDPITLFTLLTEQLQIKKELKILDNTLNFTVNQTFKVYKIKLGESVVFNGKTYIISKYTNNYIFKTTNTIINATSNNLFNHTPKNGDKIKFINKNKLYSGIFDKKIIISESESFDKKYKWDILNNDVINNDIKKILVYRNYMFNKDDKVYARYKYGMKGYSCKITNISNEGIHVLFDDDDIDCIPPHHIYNTIDIVNSVPIVFQKK